MKGGGARIDRRGLAFGLAAYGIWGLIPLYFKLLKAVPPIDIVAHRIGWSLAALGLLTWALGRGAALRTALGQPRTLGLLAAAAVLIGANWLVYVWAVNSGQIVATGIGYYLNPIANVLLGRLVLGERLDAKRWAAVGLAGIGVALLAGAAMTVAGSGLWISLVLCLSFAAYGLIKRVAAVDALPGLTIETMVLAPVALAWLTLGAHLPYDRIAAADWGLLAVSGIVTATPLLAFAAAARRLTLASLGMIQFLSPTIQLLLGTFLFGETVSALQWLALGFIWAGLALYAAQLVAAERRAV